MLDFGFASDKDIRVELIARLRANRLLQGLTQADLALRAGVNLGTIKLVETKYQCTLETFTKIILALGLSNHLQNIFLIKPQSIAAMEKAFHTPRLRARRKSSKATTTVAIEPT
ncbi:helix-turn-helix transcriptional regulator [Polynucleobacter brandtiae]|uniref:DNA-binding XRE family transcriptional regulator n=1 Tax=Polynucleobacter brandtiae TaxID=1938816 RepID=A0A2M8VR81_9BURK|nr:helix-turn-helix transcriptional regulator [Polynucleobacter brandtiae]PJI79951.1 DNA-binding XRE family transcriptional regulator [Polynucleobacter brandtiae]